MFNFELDFDIRKNEDILWMLAFIALLIGALVGLAQIGRIATPVDAGAPRLLGWSDWRLLQAERAYAQELSLLRSDATQLSAMLDQRPSPVAAQLLAEQIARHIKSGDASLANARLALGVAAMNVRDWSTGVLDRDTAILSLQDALTLLR